jgi:hypothetical protein
MRKQIVKRDIPSEVLQNIEKSDVLEDVIIRSTMHSTCHKRIIKFDDKCYEHTYAVYHKTGRHAWYTECHEMEPVEQLTTVYNVVKEEVE